MSEPRPFSVCVYCGSRQGLVPAHAQAARDLGRQMGERGWRLVYGGAQVGLMGEVADAALAAGGSVIGVMPQRLMRQEVAHHGLTELHVVGSMHERKQRMAEQADAFVALPGGIGTFEELFEVWTWRHIGYHERPIGLLNSAGFYDPLLTFLEQAVKAGFMDESQLAMLSVAQEPTKLLDELARCAAALSGPTSFRLI